MRLLSWREACEIIAETLANENAAILCVGSRLRGDDAACLILCEKLQMVAPEKAEVCEHGLENCPVFSIIEERGLREVLICDTMMVPHIAPGVFAEIELRELRRVFSLHVSTHSFQQAFIAEKIAEYYPGVRIRILAVNAKSFSLSPYISNEVESALISVAHCVREKFS